MKYYIVVFDRVPYGLYKKFHEDFISNTRISRWFHYIKSSYIIGTTMDASELSAHFAISAIANGLPKTHLILQVDLNDRYGLLPEAAWAWMKRNTTET